MLSLIRSPPVVFCTYDCTFDPWRLHLCVGAPLRTYGKVQTIGAVLIAAACVPPSPRTGLASPQGYTLTSFRWTTLHAVVMVGSDEIADTPAPSRASAIPHHRSGSPLLARGPVVGGRGRLCYLRRYL